MSLPLESGKIVSTARHACHCGKSFARKEHLTRHQATHDKPACICNVCQRRFSRKDLLRRHLLLHEASHTRIVVSCNACRANKTKCSGGSPCLLCVRRGINCSFRSGLRRLKRVVNASVSEDDDNDNDEPASPASSRPEYFLRQSAMRAERELLPSTVGFFQNLIIVASKPAPTGESRPLSPGIGVIYELLVAEESSLEGAIQESDELQECVAKYFRTYFQSLHLRWPILHAPTFDIRTVSLPLAASVCLMGAWFESSAKWTERFYALRVHEILLDHLLHKLIDPKSMFGGQAWPIELFQAVFLTLVFSLYRSDKSAISRAMHLRSTFVILLRELGAFNAELLAEHLKTHFSSSYTAYTQSMNERFKRLFILTYQFDAYFALAHEMPPILHRQEVRVDLPCSFSLWNTYSLDIVAKRQSEEPSGRSGFQMSAMTNCPDSFTSSQLLMEDVQLGLCGLLQAIWVLAPSSPSKAREHLSNALPRVMLIETLDAWKYELDKINELADARNITSNAARCLLLAYRGEDDSVAASLERTTTLVQDGMIVYYYLKICHYVGLNASKLIALVKQSEDPLTGTGWTSKDGREALVCALQMLKLVVSIQASGTSLNPLIWYALATGVNVTRMLVSCQKCECLATEGQHAANTNLERWTETGGPMWIDGIPVCVCKLDFWTESFERAIQNQKVMVE